MTATRRYSQTFTLTAGDTDTKTFSVTSMTYSDMFGDGYGGLTNDRLYGSSITITQTKTSGGVSSSTVHNAFCIVRRRCAGI